MHTATMTDFSPRRFLKAHADFILSDGIDWARVPDQVADICDDSRQVQPGGMFFAVSGQGFSGTDYVPAAIAAGASCVIAPEEGPLPDGASGQLVIRCRGVNALYGRACRLWYGRPDRDVRVIAVTGTNGKTSVVHLTAAVLKIGGAAKVASIGTLGLYVDGACVRALANTTPNPKTFYALLRQLADQGVACVVCEASSHGLALGRMAGCEMASAAFLNLSHEHLDFHGTMAAYLKAKRALFDHSRRHAWVDIDAPYGLEFLESLPDKNRVGIIKDARREGGAALLGHAGHQFAVVSVEMTHDARCQLVIASSQSQSERRDYRITTPLAHGVFAQNIAMALALAGDWVNVPENIDLSHAEVPGRCELLRGAEGRMMIIDYAHTPEALSGVLSGVRRLFPDRCLWLVFGCGGNRDAAKRPQMGAVAAKMADRVVVTSDNPRQENPHRIIADIRRGCDMGKTVVIPERADAIRHAVTQSKQNDIVIIAGKGHEEVQIVGRSSQPFSDREICKPFLANTTSSG